MKPFLGKDKLIHLYDDEPVCGAEVAEYVDFMPNCRVCKRVYNVKIASKIENISILILIAVVIGIVCLKYTLGEA